MPYLLKIFIIIICLSLQKLFFTAVPSGLRDLEETGLACLVTLPESTGRRRGSQELLGAEADSICSRCVQEPSEITGASL